MPVINSSKSSSSSSKHSSSSSRHKLKEGGDGSDVKIKKEKVDNPPVLNGFDFLKDTEEKSKEVDYSRKRKEERRKKEEKRKENSNVKVKEEVKEDGFARAMEGLADTFKKPSSQSEKPKRHADEDDEEERRIKRLKREESRSSER